MGSLSFEASGAARTAVEEHIGTLVADKVASRIAAKDRTLWGPEAESEAGIRLGWVGCRRLAPAGRTDPAVA
jgi:glucose-6-phosphate isomerase